MLKFTQLVALFSLVLGAAAPSFASVEMESADQAQTGWWVQANVSLTQNQVQATVTNVWGAPIACNIKTYGQVQSGQWAWAELNVIIPSGQYRYAYVYANYPYYFVNGRATAWCNWYY